MERTTKHPATGIEPIIPTAISIAVVLPASVPPAGPAAAVIPEAIRSSAVVAPANNTAVRHIPTALELPVGGAAGQGETKHNQS